MSASKPRTGAPGWEMDESFILAIAAGALDLPSFAARATRGIAGVAEGDACALFLLDETSGDLLLVGAHSLDEAQVGVLRVVADHGLVGRVHRTRRTQQALLGADPARAAEGTPGLDERRFGAMAAAPVAHGEPRVGVLVLYRVAARPFTRSELTMLRDFGTRVDVAISFVRAVGRTAGKEQAAAAPPTVGGMFRGQAISPGYALGAARILSREPAAHILEHRRLSGAEAPRGVVIDELVARTAAEIEAAQKALGRRLPEAASLLFESHLMMLQDDFFVKRIRAGQEAGMDLGRAIVEAATEFIRIFERSEHEYIREKARDVEDLALRLLDNLDTAGRAEAATGDLQVVVARELLPSDILWIAQRNVRGIVLVSGGSTAHVSLLVRSLGIPMVIVRAPELLQVAEGTRVLVDGIGGIVLVDPPEEAVRSFEHRNALAEKARLARHAMRPVTETRDGCRVRLCANINLLSEIDHALELRAEGVGLYRTELLYLMRQELPSEEDQQAVYARLLKQMGSRPVTFRTLDAGGDKVLSFFDSISEANPALGLRSTRFTLKHPTIFDRQLRAILRAAIGYDDVRVMFPMIGSIDEWRQAVTRFHVCARAVMEETGQGHNMRVGMMVELPAAVELADEFAAEAAFLSIGTNDFIQYTLGVDRGNEKVAEYYCPHHPSVLRGLHRVLLAATRRNTPVSVCGEMAHDPRYVPFFIGIGVRELSVDPTYLPVVQEAVSRYTLKEAESYATSLLMQPTIELVEARLLGKGA